MSHSENKPKTTQTSSTNVTNLNIQDTEGVTLAQSDGNVITTTDHGALQAAGDFAGELGRAAFEFGSDGFSAVDRSSGRVLEAADLAISSSRGLAEDSIAAQSSLAYDALTFGQNLLEGYVDSTRGLAEDAISSTRGLAEDALSSSRGLAEDSIASSRGLAEDSISAQRSLTLDALTFGGGVLEGAQDFARGIFADAFAQSADVLKEGQTQLGNTVTNLNAIARQQSTSEAERVQDLATKVLYAGAAMVGLVMLAGAFKSRAA